MPDKLTIVMAQLNFHVGHISSNLKKIKQSISQAIKEFNADLIVFPELALTGYPPEDLLFHSGLYIQITKALQEIAIYSHEIAIMMGYPDKQENGLYNAAALFYKGELILNYHKHLLPNYGVFDEKRYFLPGASLPIIEFKGVRLGLLICEDIWDDKPVAALASQGAELIISINASPFDQNKLGKRQDLLKHHANTHQVAMIYVQTVGGQDELVFDGGSMAVNAAGAITHMAPFFTESLFPVTFIPTTRSFDRPQEKIEAIDPIAHVYHALVIGVKDYTRKNGFSDVVLGLSGGIDSALTLAIAVDALGAKAVHAVMMPSAYTAPISLADAATLAQNLAVDYKTLPINNVFNTFLETLRPLFSDAPTDITEENLQARCRGTLLMALSNKYRWLVLTTGNKSEMAVGYATLYGDMAGSLCVLKDVSKQLVYALTHYRNQISNDIPTRIITRAPSAELAPNQADSDSLPPYEILDAIIESYVEQDHDRTTIIEQGFEAEVVDQVLCLIDRNEYKRRQAAPGIRVTTRAFGRDRRYPITSGFQHADPTSSKT